MTAKTRRADSATIAGRRKKAEQFMRGAETIRDLADDEHDIGDAYVTLCIHAGIAAADVICSIALGTYAQGEDHQAAVAHLAKVRPDGGDLADSLRTLLTMKSRAGYSHENINATDRKRARRASQRLLDAMRERRVEGSG
ncbi:MAG: hypothetical protein ACRDK4_11395 [Solirubrobacteraceae bacterium]